LVPIGGFLSAIVLRLMLGAVPLEPASAAESEALFSGGEFFLLGRALILTETTQAVLQTIYTGAALLFLLSAVWPQGPDFVVAGLAALAPLAVVLQAEPFSFGAVAMLVAAAFLVPLANSGRSGETLAPMRYLFLTALALPPLLVAGWMLESEQLVLAGAIWRLILLAILLLVGGFPFHVWIRPLFEEAPPLATVFVLSIVQLAALTFAWQLLQRFPGVQANVRFVTLLAWGGAITALVAAILTFNEVKPRRLLSYTALGDIGVALVALSLDPGSGQLARTILVARFVSLTIAAAGLQIWEKSPTSLPARLSLGSTAANRLAVLLFGFGVLSLAGFPLTAGFSGRWTAISLAGSNSLWLALPLLLATTAPVLGLMRVFLPQPAAEDVPAVEEAVQT
jgi:NADH:ubiquinone oxidoreductase subunit 2 (subunit N)